MKPIDENFAVTAAPEHRVVFYVRVVPGSSRTSMAGFYNGMLKVKISAAPEKGKANKALLDFLSSRIGVSKKAIAITSGHTCPVKQVTVNSITVEDLLERLKSR